MTANNKARIAGVFYLLTFLTGGVAVLLAPFVFLDNAHYLSVFNLEQLQALTLKDRLRCGSS